MLEPDAVRAQCRAFIKINWNRKLLPDSVSGFMSQIDAVNHGDAADRNERQNVGGANAWVYSRMSPQIDQHFGGGDGGDGRVDNYPRFANEGNHRSVVVDVEVTVQNHRPVDRFNCPRDLIDR